MAVRNTFAIYINGKNVTRYVVQPIKWSNLLDEQLDEAVISLRRCPLKSIPPLSPVQIQITNQIYFGHGANERVHATDTMTKYYFTADQSDSTETPPGSNRYDHNLPIIEVTKYLERFVIDSITYTNDLGRTYANDNTPLAQPEWLT